MMRTKGLAIVALCLLALIWAMPAAAQEQTGSIQGVVKDSSGAVLPGVTIEARSPTVVGASTAVTDAQGNYRFPALPPGTYTVSATLQGFNAQKITGTITLGQLLKVDITMSVGGVAETVQVTGEAPLIDTKQSAAFATVSQDIIERIPKGRDFTDVIAVAPGANAEAKSGGLQVDGASGSENRFIIDGMDTTNLQNGISGKTMLVDFIQEVQVKSSGYNAEFGGSTGGVVSAITRSGSNQMRGSVGVYEENNHFRGSLDNRGGYSYSNYNGTNGIPNPQGCGTGTTLAGLNCTANQSLQISALNPWQYYSPVADFGGPLVKDKIWYYGGMAYTRNYYTLDTRFIQEPGHPLHHFADGSWAYYPNYNITSQLTSSMRLRVAGSNQRNRSRGYDPGANQQPINRVFDADLTRYKPTTCPNLAYQDMAGKNLAGYTSSGTSFLSSYATGCQFNQAAFDNIYSKTGSDSRNDVLSGNLDWVLKPTFFINATAGIFRTNSWGNPAWSNDALRHTFSNGNDISNMTNPQYKDPNTSDGVWPSVPGQYQGSTGYTDQSVASSLLVRNIYNRYYLNANAIAYRSFAGQHVIKGGLRFERFGEDIYTGFTKPVITFYWGRVDNTTDGRTVAGKYGYYMINKTGSIGAVWSNNVAFWLQDSWTVQNKLTINAGVRAENEHVPSFKTGVPSCADAPTDPNCAIDIQFGFHQKIAPRLGFAYDIKGDSRWKAYGSFGVFYDITKLELPRGSFGGEHWIDYYWTLDTYDWASITCGEGTTGCPGTFIESWDGRHSSNQADPIFAAYFNRPGMTGIDPNILPVKTGEATFGLDHELNATMSVSARYVHKWMTRTIEDIGILANGVEDYLIGNPGFGYSVNMEPLYPKFTTPKATRDYDGIELRLRKRLANRWSTEIDYTYSRLWGNYGGLASSDESGRTSPNVNRYFDNLYMSYDENNQSIMGLLATDRPHVLKVQATYDLPWGTTLGAFGTVMSGLPQSSQLSYNGYPVYYAGRNDLGRLPIYKQVDLSVQHDLRIGGRRRVSLAMNVTNLFDVAGYTSLYTTFPYRDGVTPGPDPKAFFYGGPWTAAGAVANVTSRGGTVRTSDFYNVLNGFQGVRAVRFQAKFSF
jgi:hypothetical protein